MKARKVILLGAKWRVDDGESIWIFKDCWLPRSIVTPIPSVLDSEARVAELIDSEVGGWNDQMLDLMLHSLRSTADQVHSFMCILSS